MLKIKVNGKVDYQITSEQGVLKLNNQDVHWDIIKIKDKHFHIIKDRQSYNAEVLSADLANKTFSIRVNANNYTVEAKDKYDELLKQLGMDVSASHKVNEIKAPMPGLVLRLMAEAGQSLKKGDSVVVLEAMKMENVLKSGGNGVIKEFKVKKGDKVEKGQVLVVME